ncbi:MAG: hypothetical protein PWR29_728 [Methanolobus sp.]|jgi:hypothetical protein|nr:hypothetical protein [Methanolobus sp.]MDK2911771.1 hypothetical protein [Methanolobus sp.]MDN5310051.1 hypothetical protein [Methanolobus sp.]
MIKNKIGIRALLFTALVLSIMLIPTVSAEKLSKTIDQPSELEQGLIDALNSNTENISTDEIIANYFKDNEDKISKNSFAKNDKASDKDNLRTYQLEDGSLITFMKKGDFYISSMEEESNSEIVTQRAINAATSYSYTPILTASKSFYSPMGVKLFTVYSKGYYRYDGNTVKAYYMDSWYTKGYLSIWQVSNWEEGGYDYASAAVSEIYGRGNFHYGFEYQGVGLVIQDKYVTVKSICDKNGNYQFLWSAY